MGNRTSEENWAARERLAGIERMLWWRGYVGRPDLRELYGLSPAQASSDLQRYQVLNPGAMGYQVNRKRYEAAGEMRCVMGEPQFEVGVGMFLGGRVATVGGGWGGGLVEEVVLPVRSVRPEVEQGVVRALLTEARIAVRYRAVKASDSKSGEERWLQPRRLVWDGARWHVRAWCELRERYADFVLSRIEKVGAVEVVAADENELPVDEDWERWEVLDLTPNSELGKTGEDALRYDFDLEDGASLEIKVRAALKPYLRERMGVVGGGERFWVEQ